MKSADFDENSEKLRKTLLNNDFSKKNGHIFNFWIDFN